MFNRLMEALLLGLAGFVLVGSSGFHFWPVALGLFLWYSIVSWLIPSLRKLVGMNVPGRTVRGMSTEITWKFFLMLPICFFWGLNLLQKSFDGGQIAALIAGGLLIWVADRLIHRLRTKGHLKLRRYRKERWITRGLAALTGVVGLGILFFFVV